MKYVGIGFFFLALATLAGCSSRFDTGIGGHAPAPSEDQPTYDDELRTLREERRDLDSRITAARMREDTSGLGNRSPFPDQDMEEDVDVLIHRKKTVETRIRDLEEREPGAGGKAENNKEN